MTLFDQNKIVHNFRNMDTLGFSYNIAYHGINISNFNKNQDQKFLLPEFFNSEYKCYNVDAWLEENWVTGLVVLKINNITNATLLSEQYFRGNDRYSKVISWSTGKSFVSALVGIAIRKGYINSINDHVTKYVPVLKESGYNEVKIKDVLQMSSGVKFDEDYSNFWSDINKMSRSMALGGNFDNFMMSLKQENQQNQSKKVHNYISTDTQVLGMVIKGATNESLTDFLQENLWGVGGFECDLFWLLDNCDSHRELAFGTINTCTRDYARFGWLYLNKGKSPLDGKQIISAEWVNKSVTPDEPYLMPGMNKKFPLGYGYQWWIPGNPNNNTQPLGDYLAIGVYGQFIYVSPMNNVVIAMNSANPNYNMRSDLLELETIEMFRAIATEANSIKI